MTSPLPGTIITNLPVAISLDGSEEVPVVQGGTTKRTTSGAIANLTPGAVPSSRAILTITGSGLTGGGTLATDLSLKLEVSNLTEETSPDNDNFLAVANPLAANSLKVSPVNFYKTINVLTHKTVPASADKVPIYSLADSAGRYSTVTELLAAAGSLPAGGTIGQPLIKRSSTDFDTEFATLPVIGGGTGAITLTDHGVLLGQGTSAVVATAVMSNGQLLIGQSGADPAPTTVSGDVTISNLGVTAIGANKVTNAMLRQSAGLSVIGRSAATLGDVADITGTANQILRVDGAGTTLGFGSIDLSQSAAVGSSVLGATNGGTSQSTYALGDTLYASATNTLAKLAGNTTAAIQYLSQTGTGSASAAPVWTTISGGDISGAALTRVDDTNVTLTLGGSPSTALLRATSLTLGWTGQLGLSRGGTASDLSATGGAGQFLKQASAGAAVTVTTVAASEISSPAALTRVDDTNVTITLGGSPSVSLLAATSLTLGWTGQLAVSRGGTGLSSGTSGGILGFTASGTLASSAALGQYGVVIGGGAGATPTAITAGTDGQLLLGVTSAAPAMATMSGDATITNAGVLTIANSAVSNAKLANSAAYTLKGNFTGSAAAPQDSTIGALTQKVTPAGTDLVLIQDEAASGQLKYALVSSISGSTGVSSIAGNTGAFTLSLGITNSTNDIRLDAKPAFRAHKNGTDQTGVADATFTQVTYSTEVYDTGGYFASNTWTPPAGLVSLSAAAITGGTITSGAIFAIAIYKNGVAIANTSLPSGTNQGSGPVVVSDRANGTDAYAVYVYQDVSSGTATINGAPAATFFCGEWLSP